MRSLTGKLTLAIGLATILFSTFLFYRTYMLTDQRISEAVQRQAELGLQFNLSIRSYVAAHVRPLMYELLGEDEFIPEVVLEEWQGSWKDLGQKGSLLIETVHQRKDGSVFPVEIVLNRINFGGDEYKCAFARDISERKKTELERQRLEKRLNSAKSPRPYWNRSDIA